MIKSDPTELIVTSADWRFLNALKRELIASLEAPDLDRNSPQVARDQLFCHHHLLGVGAAADGQALDCTGNPAQTGGRCVVGQNVPKSGRCCSGGHRVYPRRLLSTRTCRTVRVRSAAQEIGKTGSDRSVP